MGVPVLVTFSLFFFLLLMSFDSSKSVHFVPLRLHNIVAYTVSWHAMHFSNSKSTWTTKIVYQTPNSELWAASYELNCGVQQVFKSLNWDVTRNSFSCITFDVYYVFVFGCEARGIKGERGGKRSNMMFSSLVLVISLKL